MMNQVFFSDHNRLIFGSHSLHYVRIDLFCSVFQISQRDWKRETKILTLLKQRVLYTCYLPYLENTAFTLRVSQLPGHTSFNNRVQDNLSSFSIKPIINSQNLFSRISIDGTNGL